MRCTNSDDGKPVTYASGRKRDGVSLFVFHIPDAILWKIDATWDKEKIDLAICDRVRNGEAGRVRAEGRRYLVVCQCSLVERQFVWRGRWHVQASEQRHHARGLRVAVSSLENGDKVPRPEDCSTWLEEGVVLCNA
jgi:hypothetical protein